MRAGLTEDLADRLAGIALGHVRREYPNKPDHVLGGPEDLRGPRALHPVFHGSFDWHSCVHAHWMLARLLRRCPGLPEAAAVRALLDARSPDAVVCANDRTAALLMRTVMRLGCHVPGDLRIVGIDDAEMASVLPVPLTTLRQPSRQIGDAALAAMLERVARKELPTRDILLHCDLVVRESCGARLAP
jgi:hypothetical protein